MLAISYLISASLYEEEVKMYLIASTIHIEKLQPSRCYE